MTAQLLTTELTTLIQDAKRKNPGLRTAAEKSLAELNGLPRTSEAQIAADLRARVNFVTPFLIACDSRNPKFAGHGVACLQRLILANAVPKDAISSVFDSLRESASLSLDIQLKVLQALPTLLQNFGDRLHGRELLRAFQICFILHDSKTAVVTNLAAAALQQVVNASFERVLLFEKDSTERDDLPQEYNNKEFKYRYRMDVFNIFLDICSLTEGSKAEFVEGASLSQNFGLELIESMISNYTILFHRHDDLEIPFKRILPLITRILTTKSSFATTVRCMRLIESILRNLTGLFPTDCEVIMSLLIHLLEPDGSTLWKRSLCLEVFKNLHADPDLIRELYARFDARDGRRNVIRDHLGSLVRLASERPAIIGLGQHSSVPIEKLDDSGEQAALQAGGVVGSIGASATATDINSSGISNQWSDPKSPCIDQLDKSEPPSIPATYIYKLALNCLTSFQEGLARYLLPFTVVREKKVRRKQTKSDQNERQVSTDGSRPPDEEVSKERKAKTFINPTSLKDHPAHKDIAIANQMVDQCWPALLATSSTFLNASMDSENFHTLIRSFQKFTQIAGLLDLSTPRDAFLTQLGKSALPVSQSVIGMASPRLGDDQFAERADEMSRDSSPAPPNISRPPTKRQQTANMAAPTLDSRQLLCLRALLNLGIALGPSLGQSWSIILETLQQADLLMSGSGTRSQRPRSRDGTTSTTEADSVREDIGLEMTAVETASVRLFESTRDFEGPAFMSILQCLCDLLREDSETLETQSPASKTLSPGTVSRRHQKLRSISGTIAESSSAHHNSVFVLEKMRQIIRYNIPRLVKEDMRESGWDLLHFSLMSALRSTDKERKIRLGASTTLNEMLVQTAVFDGEESSEAAEVIRERSLNGILTEVSCLHKTAQISKTSQQCEFDIHRGSLDALRSILDHVGDSLKQGWPFVFRIILSAFFVSSSAGVAKSSLRSPALTKAAFNSVELICSDFISCVPISCMSQLLDTLFRFASQDYDLNVSLTTSTFFRTLSDHLLRDLDIIDVSCVAADDLLSPNTDRDISKTKAADLELLWMSLLTFLVDLTADARIEARHGTIQTIFRILSSNAEKISPESTLAIFGFVIDRILKLNRESLGRATGEDAQDISQEASEWHKTAVLIIDEVTKLLVQWLDTYKTDKVMLGAMDQTLIKLSEPVQRHVLIVSKAVFSGLTSLFAEMEEGTITHSRTLEIAWELWRGNNPSDHQAVHGKSRDNNEALLAYHFCLGQLLRLSIGSLREEDAEMVLEQLLISVTQAISTAYSSDVDTMSPVQKAAIESLKMLPRLSDAYDFKLFALIKKFANLAYKPQAEPSAVQSSFVALSKASMVLLDGLIHSRIQSNKIIPSSPLPTLSLSALQEPLRLKYNFSRPGRDPTTWKKATTSTISILQASASLPRDLKTDAAFWTEVVQLTASIVSASPPQPLAPAINLADQSFDTEAFTTIHALLLPAISSSSIPQSLRTTYASSLFTTSLIHTPHPDDLALESQPLFSGLYTTHFGQTKLLPSTPRSQLAYRLFTTLFELAANPAMAAQATPYLLLRVALVLKTYVYDQSLRGYFPLPWSQRQEMEFVLHRIVGLEAREEGREAAVREIEAAEILVGRLRGEWEKRKGGGGMNDEGEWSDEMVMQMDFREWESAKVLKKVGKWQGEKWILGTLYPLLLRALRAAKKDEKMVEVIEGVLEQVE